MSPCTVPINIVPDTWPLSCSLESPAPSPAMGGSAKVGAGRSDGDEQAGEVVDGEEVRLLDLEHGERGQAGGEQAEKQQASGHYNSPRRRATR